MKTRLRDEFCRRGVRCILKSTWIEEALLQPSPYRPNNDALIVRSKWAAH